MDTVASSWLQVVVNILFNAVVIFVGMHGLSRAISEMKRDSAEGFRGVHSRLDMTNGRVGRLEKWRAYEQGLRDAKEGRETAETPDLG